MHTEYAVPCYSYINLTSLIWVILFEFLSISFGLKCFFHFNCLFTTFLFFFMPIMLIYVYNCIHTGSTVFLKNIQNAVKKADIIVIL